MKTDLASNLPLSFVGFVALAFYLAFLSFNFLTLETE